MAIRHVATIAGIYMAKRVGVWRVRVFLVGVALVLVLILPIQGLLGTDSRLLTPIFVASYGIVGGVLGFLFPEKGWRSGFWLVVFFLLLLLGSGLLVGSPIPWDWQKEIRNLIENAMIISAAFMGAAIGSLIRRRLGANSSTEH